ncbi:hypothetical protein [Methylobacterium nodulans]|uniref:Uncharacterized protein n=1 Tax=Methylobacterium nodulans (strain LMG 21967 / CNCM I-2342 / ORS 2060) TaxID=460265 RepID=B8INZ2_METNO|nr:hypothetical protein [Methylobacterium nodulans]ACL58508.1 conserved hypothetical protein [Methylobacterium nodulans ORS 2060]
MAQLLRAIYPPEHASRLSDRAGEPYRPSNGTEGDIFAAAWCSDCRKRPRCRIPLRAMAHDISERGYPHQWRYGGDGQPICTAHDNGPPPPRRARPCRRTGDLFGQMPEVRHVG